MIDISEIRQSFRQRLGESGIIPAGSTEYENRDFEPTGKAFWVRENYTPAFENRVTSQGDNLGGVFSYTVFTPIGTADTLAVSKGVAIGNLWQTSEVIETANYKTSIVSTSCGFQGTFDDVWYQYKVDIQIRAFEK